MNPNSSGIWLFLAIVPGILVSVFILYEYIIFTKYKLTLRDIWIIELNNNKNLKILIIFTYKVPGKPLIATIATEHKNIKINNALDIAFISRSIEPNLGCGSELFFWVRVSLPTIPVAFDEAIFIVFAHNVCSKDNPSFFIFNSFEPTYITNTPLNWYICLVGGLLEIIIFIS